MQKKSFLCILEFFQNIFQHFDSKIHSFKTGSSWKMMKWKTRIWKARITKSGFVLFFKFYSKNQDIQACRRHFDFLNLNWRMTSLPLPDVSGSVISITKPLRYVAGLLQILQAVKFSSRSSILNFAPHELHSKIKILPAGRDRNMCSSTPRFETLRLTCCLKEKKTEKKFKKILIEQERKTAWKITIKLTKFWHTFVRKYSRTKWYQFYVRTVCNGDWHFFSHFALTNDIILN